MWILFFFNLMITDCNKFRCKVYNMGQADVLLMRYHAGVIWTPHKLLGGFEKDKCCPQGCDTCAYQTTTSLFQCAIQWHVQPVCCRSVKCFSTFHISTALFTYHVRFSRSDLVIMSEITEQRLLYCLPDS